MANDTESRLHRHVAWFLASTEVAGWPITWRTLYMRLRLRLPQK